MASGVKKARPDLSTRIDFGISLAFARLYTTLYGRLSLNISREVFTYIGLDFFCLTAISGKNIHVYDLRTETLTISAEVDVNPNEAGLVMMQPDILLVVGGLPRKSAYSVQIWSGVVTQEADMSVHRSWPGMLAYEEWVWVFGGNTANTLDSVERLHRGNRTWQSGPRMLSPKVCFTPCGYQGLIYLAETSHIKKHLEVLNPVTEEYTLLPLELTHNLYGSISFIDQGALVLLNCSCEAGVWSLGSTASSLETLSITKYGVDNCYTNGTPVRYSGAVYWLDGQFRLAKFILETHELRLCATGPFLTEEQK